MCRRYRITKSADEIEQRFGAVVDREYYRPNPNASTGQDLPVILNVNPRMVTLFKWGLIPSWAKDPAIGNSLVNARAETLAEKPSFKGSLKYWRCLVPADGFYEWKHVGSKKQPYLITLKDEGLFSFAGLWAEWSAPDGSPIPTFTIVTTEPNELMKDIHDRMPVILAKEDERTWLRKDTPIPQALQLLKQYPAELMQAKAVASVGKSDAQQYNLILRPRD